jgi:Holliday junction DNA helicase RuvA
MATSIGPLFAIKATLDRSMNRGDRFENRTVVLSSEKMGLAYECFAVSKTLVEKLERSGETWVYLAQVIKEDGESLFAFETLVEREIFSELREIDSIGSKFAATAVAELGARGLSMMLTSNQMPAIKITGLGPKTLEKIRSGMKERVEIFSRLLKNAQTSGAESLAGTEKSREGATASSSDVSAAASSGEVPALLMQALSQLGLKTQDVFNVFDEGLKKNPALLSLASGEQIKILLATWNQMKKALRKDKGVSL